MKFSRILDESLFDDDVELFVDTPVDTLKTTTLDDDFSEYIDEHSLDNVLEGPAEGSDTGVASEIIALINDEWEAIQGYNNAIATLRANQSSNPFYDKAISVLEEISAEENAHVGQLQEVLKQISPNATEINKGEAEAKSQMGLVGGVLPVQSWDNPVTTDNANIPAEEEICQLCDVDDDM